MSLWCFQWRDLRPHLSHLDGCLPAREGVRQRRAHRDERDGVDGVLQLDEAAHVRRDVTDQGDDDADRPDGEEEAQVAARQLCKYLFYGQRL